MLLSKNTESRAYYALTGPTVPNVNYKLWTKYNSNHLKAMENNQKQTNTVGEPLKKKKNSTEEVFFFFFLMAFARRQAQVSNQVREVDRNYIFTGMKNQSKEYRVTPPDEY